MLCPRHITLYEITLTLSVRGTVFIYCTYVIHLDWNVFAHSRYVDREDSGPVSEETLGTRTTPPCLLKAVQNPPLRVGTRPDPNEHSSKRMYARHREAMSRTQKARGRIQIEFGSFNIQRQLTRSSSHG